MEGFDGFTKDSTQDVVTCRPSGEREGSQRYDSHSGGQRQTGVGLIEHAYSLWGCAEGFYGIDGMMVIFVGALVGTILLLPSFPT